MSRSGGRWGEASTPEKLAANIKDLLFDVPVYDKSMTYHPFSSEQIIIIRFVGECALCGRYSKTGRGMIAHHRAPLGPAELTNGRCVCKSCHDWISFMLRKVKSYPSGVTKESFGHISSQIPMVISTKKPSQKRSNKMTAKQKRMLYVLGDRDFAKNKNASKSEASDRIKELIAQKNLNILNAD